MTTYATMTDPVARDTAPSDEIIRVRRWGSDWLCVLPRPGESEQGVRRTIENPGFAGVRSTPEQGVRRTIENPSSAPLRGLPRVAGVRSTPEQGVRRTIELTIGTASGCDIRVSDPDQLVSSTHARLVFDGGNWRIFDNNSKNGLWIDGQRCESAAVRAGTEIGLGRKFILIAESARSISLRTFLARILGWTNDRTTVVDHALRSVLATSAQRGAIVLCSESDPVAIAHSIHRMAFGAERPFVTCDPKRKSTTESVRWTQNFARGGEALAAAAGGTLCVWASRLPPDFGDVWAALVEPTATVRLIMCSNKPIDGKKYLAVPIVVPSLADRQLELGHIIKDYASDAVAELGGEEALHIQRDDLDWILHNESSSLAKIETATLRLVALRMYPNVNQAAERLGMARISLASWIARRELPVWNAQ